MTLEVVSAETDAPDGCQELHCADEHPDFDPQQRDDALRHAVTLLAGAYHGLHDQRFPWRLCSDEVCRETSFALGVRP